VSLVEHELFTI